MKTKLKNGNEIDVNNNLLENTNFRNNQNYIYMKDKIPEKKYNNDFDLCPLYDDEFIMFLNNKFNSYQFDTYYNKLLLYIFGLLYLIQYYNIDLSIIKGKFWKIKKIYVKEAINIKKDISDYTGNNFRKDILGIKDNLFLSNFGKGIKFIETDKLIFEIKYYSEFNSYTYGNYFNTFYMYRGYNLFNKRIFKYNIVYNSLISLAFFLIFLFIIFF